MSLKILDIHAAFKMHCNAKKMYQQCTSEKKLYIQKNYSIALSYGRNYLLRKSLVHAVGYT